MAGKKQIPDSVRQEWEKLAKEGLGANQIAIKTKNSWCNVSAHLKRVGLFKKGLGKNSKISDDQKAEIIALYKSGIGATTIGKKFKIDKGAVYYVLNRSGTGTRSVEARVAGPVAVRNHVGLYQKKERKRKRILNEQAFDILTPESLYWIGLLWADGSVGMTEIVLGLQGTVCINLMASDIAHLRSYAKFLGTNKQVRLRQGVGYAGKTGCCKISVSSTILCNRLIALGMAPNKSHTDPAPHPSLAASPDFWRGVWDGDGTLSYSPPYLAGGRNTLLAWIAWANSVGIESRQPEFTETTHRSYIITDPKILIEKLGWLSSPTSLLRKRLTAQAIIEPSFIVPRLEIEPNGKEHNTLFEGVLVTGRVFQDGVFLVDVLPQVHNEEAIEAIAGKSSARSFWVRAKDYFKTQDLRLMLRMPGDNANGWASIISSRLHLLSTKIMARKCTPTRVGAEVARVFYKRTHIQGFVGGTHYALIFNGSPVAIMTLGRPLSCRAAGVGGLLSRFAADGHVQGAAGKLLSVSQRDHPKDVWTFSDNRYTDGRLYETLGFTKTDDVAPSYSYWKSGSTFHKSRCKRSELWEKQGFKSNSTEQQLTREMGYKRLWDMGKMKWFLKEATPGFPGVA